MRVASRAVIYCKTLIFLIRVECCIAFVLQFINLGIG